MGGGEEMIGMIGGGMIGTGDELLKVVVVLMFISLEMGLGKEFEAYLVCLGYCCCFVAEKGLVILPSGFRVQGEFQLVVIGIEGVLFTVEWCTGVGELCLASFP